MTTASPNHPPEYLVPAALNLRLRVISRPVLPEILAVFSQETAERIPCMFTMFQAGDWKGLGDQVHALKGSAGHFGLPLLSAGAREIELAAKAGEAAGRSGDGGV
ncbi:MAG: Hpt domain-containing protein [Gammaproteobacteria bacterium]|nr:Hpt domain-containing protein [Gammaproteobacteria bacterium]MBU1962867.1 Hpt domain-containing protein [Gammaproteobacteria bacterium]